MRSIDGPDSAPNITRLPGQRGRRVNALDLQTRTILLRVATALGMDPDLLLQRSRRADIAHARQLAIYLCYVGLGWRMSTIARLFARHPSTVSYACARIEDLRDDPQFDALVTRLEETLESDHAEPETEPLRAAG